MSTNRSRRIDRDTAEQLLGGAVAAPSAGQDASLTGPDGGPGQLARVLAAAAAPATAGELAGEEAALAAFREASLMPDPVVTPVRRRSMATAALARAFSTKAAAAVLGATALCGVAVAAGTGNLPSPLGGGPAEPERTLSAGGVVGERSGTSPAGGTGTATGSAQPPGTGSQQVAPSAAPTSGAPSTLGRGDQPVSRELAALCRGFVDRTGKGERTGQVAADPQFGPLVAEAGGADKVADYCAVALGTAAGDGHPGADAGAQSHAPGRGAGSPAADTGKGGGDDTKGTGTGDRGNNANGGAKPGKPGAAVPTPSVAPSPPAARPSKSSDGTAAER